MTDALDEIKYATLPPVSEEATLDFGTKVIGLGGPVGTGKTIALGIKIMLAAAWIKPNEKGVKHTKFIIARRRYGDLEATIVDDFEKVIAPGIFNLSGRRSPRYATIDYDEDDGTRVYCELYFYAFETEEDLLKIKSAKFTCAVIIEGQEFPRQTYAKKIVERINRFPTPPNADELTDEEVEENTAIEWLLPDGRTFRNGWLAMDINYPSRQHWLNAYFGKDNPTRPDGTKLRKLYRQPPTHIFLPGVLEIPAGQRGVIARYRGREGAFVRNPAARPYIIHNGWKYWEELILENIGDDALIQRNILAEFGTIVDGTPVHARFHEDTHVSKTKLKYMPGLPVYVGVDNNMNNAWIFGQLQPPWNKLAVIHEIVNVGKDAKTIKDAVEQDIAPYVTNVLVPAGVGSVIFVLDQAMLSEEGGHGNKQIDILNDAGFSAYGCPEKFAKPIRKVVDTWLSMQNIIIDESCSWVIEGLSGEYNFPEGKGGIIGDSPVKNLHSHPTEAFQFLVVGVSKPMAHHQTGNKPGARGTRGGDKGQEHDYLG